MKFSQHKMVLSITARGNHDSGISREKLGGRPMITYTEVLRGEDERVRDVDLLIGEDLAVDAFEFEYLISGVRCFRVEFMATGERNVTFQLVNGKLKAQCWCKHCNGWGYFGVKRRSGFSVCPLLAGASMEGVQRMASAMGIKLPPSMPGLLQDLQERLASGELAYHHHGHFGEEV